MRLIIFFIFLLCSSLSYSQNANSISGKLIDKETYNSPLAFATVLIKGTANETISNINGEYVFNNLKSGNYTLIYSFLGYKTLEKEVIITKDKTIVGTIEMQAITLSANNSKMVEKKSKVYTLLETKI